MQAHRQPSQKKLKEGERAAVIVNSVAMETAWRWRDILTKNTPPSTFRARLPVTLAEWQFVFIHQIDFSNSFRLKSSFALWITRYTVWDWSQIKCSVPGRDLILHVLTACPLSARLLPSGNASITRRLSTTSHNHHVLINVSVCWQIQVLIFAFAGHEKQTFTLLFDVYQYRNPSIQGTKEAHFYFMSPTLHNNPFRALPDQHDLYLCIVQMHESSVIYISEAVRHPFHPSQNKKTRGGRDFQRNRLRKGAG